MEQYIFLIPLLPLAGFIINLAGGKKTGSASGWIASLAMTGSFVLTCIAFADLSQSSQKSFTLNYLTWFHAGGLNIDFAFLVDPLSLLMMGIITGVGLLIHIYSIGYMKEDEGLHRFFAYMNLFVFFMLLLVMGNNFVLMFAGWEGVGLCSYLLIGFWFKNHDYNLAANKAFIMNRIGDLGFLLGLFLMLVQFGSLEFATVMDTASSAGNQNGMITAMTLLLFIGAAGKSAQIPLYTWLPDAMAGPTPVSALIHAATMVTAGIYMIVRSHILFAMAPLTNEIILAVGLATAIFAGSIGLAQNDIKKILAYSTVSQLGLMFAALGLNAYTSGMFHLTTHAFFKALLFLGAGSVIHAMGGEQDIRKMGGLKKALPITFLTFMAGTLALTGIPPFAGFFSKDEILTHALDHSPMLMVLGQLASVLTMAYMIRLVVLVFWGSFRGSSDQEKHMHESPSVITIPLIILGILSVFGGWLGLPHVLGAGHALEQFLSPVFSGLSRVMVPTPAPEHSLEIVSMGISVAVALIVMILSWRKWKQTVPSMEPAKGWLGWIEKKYLVDELYELGIVKPLILSITFIQKLVEESLIKRGVDSAGWTTVKGSRLLKNLQAGQISFYLFAMTAGFLLILLLYKF